MIVSPGISSTSSISIITTRLQLISSEAPILSLNFPLYARPDGLKKILHSNFFLGVILTAFLFTTALIWQQSVYKEKLLVLQHDVEVVLIGQERTHEQKVNQLAMTLEQQEAMLQRASEIIGQYRQIIENLAKELQKHKKEPIEPCFSPIAFEYVPLGIPESPVGTLRVMPPRLCQVVPKLRSLEICILISPIPLRFSESLTKININDEVL